MCQTWTDHEWGAPKFVESGRHASMGRFQKFLVKCEHCEKETTETRWLDVLARPIHVEGGAE